MEIVKLEAVDFAPTHSSADKQTYSQDAALKAATFLILIKAFQNVQGDEYDVEI